MEGGQVNRLLVEHDNECDLSCLVYFECILVVSNIMFEALCLDRSLRLASE